PTGACCLPDGTCSSQTYVNCFEAGGVYRGDLVPCSGGSCPTACGGGTGDMDNNCVVNGRDIQRFVNCVLASDTSAGCRCADTNDDGVPTTADIPGFVNIVLNGGGGGGPVPENPYGVLDVDEIPSPESLPPPNPKSHRITATWYSITCGIQRIRIINLTTSAVLADETVNGCPTVHTVTATANLGGNDVIQTTVQTCGPNPGHPCCGVAATDEVKGGAIQGATYLAIADEALTDKEMRTLTCPGAAANSTWARDKLGDGDVSPANANGATYTITAQHQSKPVDDIRITRSHTDGDGDVSNSMSKLTVMAIDMKIHKPKVIDPNEPAVPDADELTKGAQTFVNLDNDDQDGKYDINDDNGVAGENEMCKLRLRITPKDIPLPAGMVTLQAFAGGTQIKVWKTANKANGTDLALPANFAVNATNFTVVGDWLEMPVWIEGIAPSANKQDVKLRMTYDQLPNFKDEVALTIIGIDKIEWMGRNNSENDDNNLLNDPNFPVGLQPGALRVFPDARMTGTPPAIEANPRDIVDIKVTLTVDPLESVDIYFDSYDVDDPTSAFGPLDGSTAANDEDQERDNRGTTPAQDGQFVKPDGTSDEVGGIKKQAFTTKTATFGFRVTMQPGDNFRIVGNGDPKFFNDLVNRDQDYKTDNQAKQYIVNRHITGTAAQKQILFPDNYSSKVLTVWRNMHIEVDSMGNVAGNLLSGDITGLNTGDSTTATLATVNITTAGPLDDGSWNLSDPARNACWTVAPPPVPAASAMNGRFERGTLRVGGTHNIVLTGNGDNDVRRTGGLNICATALPYMAGGGGGANMTGTVTRVDNGSVRLTLVPDVVPPNWNVYVGGTISVGGGANMNITAVDGPGSRVTVNALRVPMTLRDDDVLQNGTDVPDPDTTGIATIWAQAFVRPLFDTGKNTGDATFRLNTAFNADLTTHTNESRGSPAAVNRYWIVLLKNGYQTDLNQDNDADREGTWRGAGGRIGGVGQAGTLILEESMRDWIAGATGDCGGNGVDPDPSGEAGRQSRRQETINHEVGHTFGLQHADGNATNRAGAQEPNGGVMAPTCCDTHGATIRKSSHFTRISLHKIRSRPFPG
ncbi:MAG TPA: hypothetical protein VMV81_14155, partial [Phycisphaerae bacterium]|nr:hypothetical protein [Phycisphaerae bacterium]